MPQLRATIQQCKATKTGRSERRVLLFTGLLCKKMNKAKLGRNPEQPQYGGPMSRLPLIGVTACTQQTGLHGYHVSDDKYGRAVAVAAKGMLLILPSPGPLLHPAEILDSLDGRLLTSATSHVEPYHDSGRASAPGTAHDPERDRTTLPLIRAAVAAEWQVTTNPDYLVIFQAFGDPCPKRALQRDAYASTHA